MRNPYQAGSHWSSFGANRLVSMNERMNALAANADNSVSITEARCAHQV